MPVLVTAADAAFGGSVVGALLREGGEVRAYASGDVGSLRSNGAIVATGTLDDEGRLDAAMTDAHTVVHAEVPWLAGSASDLERHSEVVVTAAQSAAVRRLIVLSVPGASSGHADPLHATCGRIETALSRAALPTVVVRSSLIDLPVLRDLLATTPPTEHEADTEIAPLHVDDAVAGIVALDAARSSAETGHAVFVADGQRMPLRSYLERAGIERGALVGRVYTPPDRAPLLRRPLTGPWVNTSEDGADLWDFAGLRPRPVGT